MTSSTAPRRFGSAVAAALATVIIAAGAFVVLRVLPGGPTATWRSARDPNATATADAPPPCGGWDCAVQKNFASAEALIATKPGQLGIVVRDRETGLVWEAGTPDHDVWTASTIKLAITADLLVRARAGELTITPTIRGYLDDMLKFSANHPATILWQKHGGPAALARYQSVFGMKGIHYPTSERLWGAVKCTAEDYAALMSYILEKMNPDDRDYIVHAMRTVHEVQQWGVYAAGEAWQPGNKDGWNVEKTAAGQDGWVTNSIGFAGPDERYVVSLMYELPGGTHTKGHTLDAGMQAISDVVATIFGGKVPATIPPASLVLNPPTG